jgi:ubiquinone/menaquinone biosynthesis C-methylase UbiE
MIKENSIYPLITQDWPIVEDNPKSAVLFRRRNKALKNLNKWQRQIQMFISLIKPRINDKAHILEVACGTGFMMLELSSQGLQVTGLEIDPNLVELTNVAASHFGLQARSVCGDACAIPFANCSFDIVMSNSFFEHVYDIDLALREQIRVLRKGGVLIIQDGNFLNPKVLLNLLIFYPIRSKGRYGGLKWLFTKGKVRRNLYGYLPLGRDENCKTIWWWRRKLRHMDSLRIIDVTTTAKYTHAHLPYILRPFIGGCLVVAEKIGG